MEFSFNVNRLLPESITVIHGARQKMPGKDARRRSRGGEEEETETQFELVVDAMGVASALVS